MNVTALAGRLVRDPYITYSQGPDPKATARFTLAVRRARKDGDRDADFISCIAWGKTAEFAEKYIRKGTMVGVRGRIQTGSYVNRDGVKVYTTDVVCESVEFLEKRNAEETEQAAGKNEQAAGESSQEYDDFMSIPDSLDDNLPFS